MPGPPSVCRRIASAIGGENPAAATSAAATRACNNCTAYSSSIGSIVEPVRSRQRAAPPPRPSSRHRSCSRPATRGVVGRRAPAPGEALGLQRRRPAVCFELGRQTTLLEHSFGTLALAHERLADA